MSPTYLREFFERCVVIASGSSVDETRSRTVLLCPGNVAVDVFSQCMCDLSVEFQRSCLRVEVRVIDVKTGAVRNVHVSVMLLQVKDSMVRSAVQRQHRRTVHVRFSIPPASSPVNANKPLYLLCPARNLGELNMDIRSGGIGRRRGKADLPLQQLYVCFCSFHKMASQCLQT